MQRDAGFAIRIGRPALFAFVGDAPDFLAAVVADEQTSVRHFEHSHGPAPHVLSLRRVQPACQEMLRRSTWFSFSERHESNLITLKRRAVGGPMPRKKSTALILFGK